MSNFRRHILMVAFKLSDLLIMIGSFMAATIMVSYQMETISIDQFLHMRIKVVNFVLFLGLLLIWYIIFSMIGLYRSRRLSTLKTEIKDIIKATSLGTVTIYVLSILFSIEIINPIFLVSFWAGSTMITILTRIIMRLTLNWIRRRGRNLRYLLIVGSNKRAINFARKIESKKELGYHVIGFVDNEWSGIGEIQRNGYERVANLNDFPAFLRDNVVDEAVISLPVKSHYRQASRIVALCEEQGIIVRYLSDIFNSKLGNSKVEYLEDQALVSHHTGSMEGWQLMVKRLIDVIASSILLVLLSPLFAILGILIKTTSKGPIFYPWEVVGQNNRDFVGYKFRTMTENADELKEILMAQNEMKGPVFKIKNDPRITSVGKWLRKFSLDELPQLWTVLKGDMSLVGPRPPNRNELIRYEFWQRRKISFKPGITCLWQVDGRNTIFDFEEWCRLDLEYIDNWSLWLDFKISFKTAWVVIRGTGC